MDSPTTTSATETRKADASPKSQQTLTVTDNRTGKTYELPITNGTIRAMDLRKIKVDDADFGMMSYDPAFNNTASCISRVTYIDGDAGILRYRGYPIEDFPTPNSLRIGRTTSRITRSFMKASRSFWMAFITMRTRWAC